MRVVLDTNVLVSALISRGSPARLLDAARSGHFELCTSERLLTELLDVLQRPPIALRIERAGLAADEVVSQLRRMALVLTPHVVPPVIASDPDDDHVLAAALEAGADLIASGDRRDLLPLGSYRGIPIVNPREALRQLGIAE